jgi:hypothetical protein
MPHPVRLPTIKRPVAADLVNERRKERESMWLIVLEALGALAVLVFLVWWTMFAGRRRGELPPEEGQRGERGGSRKLKG